MSTQAWPTTEGDEFYGGRCDFWLQDRRPPTTLLGGRTKRWFPPPACRALLATRIFAEGSKDIAQQQRRPDERGHRGTLFRTKTRIRSALAFCPLGSTSMRSDIFPKDRELDRAATLQGTRHLKFSHQSTRRKVNADECFAEGHLGRANELYWKAPSIDQKHSKALTNRTALHLVMSHR